MYLVPRGRWGSAEPGGQRTQCHLDNPKPFETQLHLDYLAILTATSLSPLVYELPAPSSGEGWVAADPKRVKEKIKIITISS